MELLGGLLGGTRKNQRLPRVEWTTMARRDGFEPATASFEDSCSIQLSYRRAPFLFYEERAGKDRRRLPHSPSRNEEVMT